MNWDRAERERLPADDPQEDQFVGEPVAVAAVMSRSVNEENAAWEQELVAEFRRAKGGGKGGG